MNFEEFKSRIVLVFRKKSEEPTSFDEEIRELFNKNFYSVDSLEMISPDHFRAQVSRVDWLSGSEDKLPRIRRTIVGRRMENDLVLFVDEEKDGKRRNFFEIYDRKHDGSRTLWVGDFVADINNKYLMNIVEAFREDLPTYFIQRINEEVQAKKKSLLFHKSKITVDK